MDCQSNNSRRNIYILEIADNLRRFIIPEIFCVMVAILFISFNLVRDSSISQLLSRLCSSLAVGICWSTAGCLFSEAVLSGKRKKIISLLSALPTTGIAFFVDRYYCWVGLCISALLLCAYLCSYKNECHYKIGQIASAFFASLGVSLLLFVIMWVLISGAERLFDLKLSSAGIRYAFLLTPLILIAPATMLGLMPRPDSVVGNKGKTLRFVLSWIILPSFLLLVLVLTIYIAAVIIKRELPVGQMNPFALISLVTYTALYLILTGEENKLSSWFVKWGAWPLIPIIGAQAVAVVIRISAYGLTAPRIIGIILSFVCLIQFILGILRKRITIVLVVAALLSLVLTATPLNAWSVARRAQDVRLYNTLVSAGMIGSNGEIVQNPTATEKEKETIRSVLSLLSGDLDLEHSTHAYQIIQKIKNYFTYDEGFQTVFGFSPYSVSDSDNNKNVNSVTYASSSEVDVSGFSNAKIVSFKLKKDNGYKTTIDGYEISLEQILEITDFSQIKLNHGDIPMDDGTVFRICLIRKYVSLYEPDEYLCEFWVLTP